MIQVRFKGAVSFKGLYFRQSLKRPAALQYLQARSSAKAIKMKSQCVLESFDAALLQKRRDNY